MSLTAAHRGQDKYGGAIRNRTAQAVEEANILAVDEEIDVTPHVSALVHDPVESSRRFPTERGERITDRTARLIEHERRIVFRVRAEDVGKLDGYHAVPTVPVFT